MDYTTRHTDKKTFHLKDGVVLTLEAKRKINPANPATVTLRGEKKLAVGAALIAEIDKSSSFKVITDDATTNKRFYNAEEFQFKISTKKEIPSTDLVEIINPFILKDHPPPVATTTTFIQQAPAQFKLIP